MPAWNNRKTMFSWAPPGFLQGIAPTVRNVSRRYWLNHRVWINHPDLIYFDNDRWPDWAGRPLDENEALCFASVVGLTGGIVKIGDKMVDMADDEVDVIRKLLPVYPVSARPVDLFERETAEVWVLPVETGFDRWAVVGLFNWGENWGPAGRVKEQRRTLRVGAKDMGYDPGARLIAFDFWEERLLGVFDGEVLAELDPRTVKVLAVRALRDHPWFLSYNRHITQGAMEIKQINWDPRRLALSGEQDAVPGFEYHLYFHVPAGYKLDSFQAGGAGARIEEDGDVVKLIFATNTKSASWELRFKR